MKLFLAHALYFDGFLAHHLSWNFSYISHSCDPPCLSFTCLLKELGARSFLHTLQDFFSFSTCSPSCSVEFAALAVSPLVIRCAVTASLVDLWMPMCSSNSSGIAKKMHFGHLVAMLMLIPQRPNFNWWFENEFGTKLHWLDFWEEKKLSLQVLDWRSFLGIKTIHGLKCEFIHSFKNQFVLQLCVDKQRWKTCIRNTGSLTLSTDM